MKLAIGFSNFSGLNPNALSVCVLGLGTVFLGLILLIFVCKIMGLLVKNNDKPAAAPAPVAQPAAKELPIENKQELIAAISAAVAEELGTDVSGIRIHSLKRL